jgi:K+-sensing histidine kinase KdpD
VARYEPLTGDLGSYSRLTRGSYELRRWCNWRTHRKAKERGAVGSKGAAVAIRLRDLIAPMLLTVAAILLTSLLINQAHADLTALHIWHDPEDLTLAYILPTIFITALYGSNFGVSSALVGGLGAAYFVYPPQFSFAIDSTQHLVELGFLVILSVTACKSTAVITDVKPLNRGPRRS